MQYDENVLINKVMGIKMALNKLPQSINSKLTTQFSMDDLKVTVNQLTSIFLVDVRPFCPGFDSDSSRYLLTMAQQVGVTERYSPLSIQDSKAFPLFCACVLSNAQFNIAGRDDLSLAYRQYGDGGVAECFRLAMQNANRPFQIIYGHSIIGGEAKPGWFRSLFS
jgi:hypothetical protein